MERLTSACGRQSGSGRCGRDRRRRADLPGTSVLALCAALTVAATSGAASAQSIAEVATPQADEIVVTASRIKRDEIAVSTPVLSVSAEDLAVSGATDVAGFLNELPSFLASNSPAANDSSGGAGSSFLNLRGLGAKRTLVLVNGRRHVPTTVAGSLDVSVLPSVALERVEVVTGGASAAWGSDAVAGVVNVIYDRNLSGIRTDAQFGISQEGDARDVRAAFAAGDEFGSGRGHFVVAAEYQTNNGIADQKDRDWGSRRWGVIRNPADKGPADGIPARLIRENANLLIATEGGLILGPGPVANLEFTPGGGLVPFQPGSIISPPYMIGGSGANFGQYAALLQPYERQNAFVAVEYELTDGIKAFVEGGFAATDGHSDIVQSFALGNLVIRADNAFIPAELSQRLAANNIPAFTMGRLNTDMGFIRTDRTQRMHRAVIGLEGDLSDTWSWETYFQYGRANSTERLTNNFIPGNFALATDAVRDPSGNIVCRATLNPATAARAQGCVPLNVFGFGAPSLAAIDYVSGTSIFEQEQSQKVFAGEIGGDLATLWAGPLSVAAGFEYRKEEFEGVGDSMGAAGQFLLGNGQDLAGSFDVKELFGEALLPLLSDLSFAKRLELSAAARLTDYNTVGQVTTWKLGVVWDTNQSLILRASHSRDIRAPSIGELFAPQGTSFFTPTDPCDARSRAANPAFAASCTAAGIPASFNAANGLIKVLTGGNPDLQEERAKTTTIGAVVAPSAIPGLQGSVDWYDIKLKDAIQIGLPVNAILNGCYGAATYPTELCKGVTRDAAGQLVSVASTGLNVAQYRVKGVDAQLSYAFDVPPIVGDGDATIRLVGLGTHLIEQSDTSTLKKIDRAGELRRDNSGLPKWRWNANATYSSDAFDLSTQVRYVGGGKYDNTYTAEDIDDNKIGAQWYMDVSASVKLDAKSSQIELFAGINNLWNNDPPVVPYEFAISALATNPGLYDTIGRYIYGGIRVKI